MITKGNSPEHGPHSSLGWNKDLFTLCMWQSWHHRGEGPCKRIFVSHTLPEDCCLCSTTWAIKTVPGAFSTWWKLNKAAKSSFPLNKSHPFLSRKKGCLPSLSLLEYFCPITASGRWETWPLQLTWQDPGSGRPWGSVCYTLCSRACTKLDTEVNQSITFSQPWSWWAACVQSVCSRASRQGMARSLTQICYSASAARFGNLKFLKMN